MKAILLGALDMEADSNSLCSLRFHFASRIGNFESVEHTCLSLGRASPGRLNWQPSAARHSPLLLEILC